MEIAIHFGIFLSAISFEWVQVIWLGGYQRSGWNVGYIFEATRNVRGIAGGMEASFDRWDDGNLPAVFGDDHLVGQLLKFAPEVALLERDAALALDSAGRIRFDESAPAGPRQRDSAFRRRQDVLCLVVVVGVQGGFVHFKSHPHPEFRADWIVRCGQRRATVDCSGLTGRMHWHSSSCSI